MSAGITALAVHYPTKPMPNEHWLEHHPEMIAKAQSSSLSRVWQPAADGKARIFDEEMAPYVKDPFRGAKMRWWLAPGETALSLEIAAAQKALAAAQRSARDVDLAIVSSFFPDQVDVGNAAFLAKALGLKAAWNMESACTSSILALSTACALVDAGQAERVLVVISCTYSKVAPDTESISLANGDGAAAFVVERVPEGRGLLAQHTASTWQTCGAVTSELKLDDHGQPCIRMRADKTANALLRETSETMVRECVGQALAKARLSVDDVAFFVFNTPTAWYASFCARALGVDVDKTVNTHPLYANTGPVLMPTGLLHACHANKLAAGDVVVLYGVGSVSNAAAAVLRMDPPALGPLPG